MEWNFFQKSLSKEVGVSIAVTVIVPLIGLIVAIVLFSFGLGI